jgi:hypothetical protein
VNSNLLGNVAGARGGAVRSQGVLVLDSTLVGHSTGRAIDASIEGETTLEWSVFWANPDGDLPLGSNPEGGTYDQDPVLRGYTPGGPCGAFADLPGFHGPLRGGGNPTRRNPVDELSLDSGTLWVSDADVGAFGGPDGNLGGVWDLDLDGDGIPLVYDCDDGNASISPLAPEEYYNGTDGNCDQLDDYDADGDGVVRELDCDDSDPEVFPGAEEELGAGRDKNCDGLEDHDGDGYAPPEDCDDDDRAVNPGVAEDANPTRDANCDGVADVVRPLVPRSCVVGGVPPVAGWVALVAGIAARRRR